MSEQEGEGPPSARETEGGGAKVISLAGRSRSRAPARVREKLKSATKAANEEDEKESLLAVLERWDLDQDVTDLSAKIEAGRGDLRPLRDSLRNWRAVRNRLRGNLAAAYAEWAELIEEGDWRAQMARASYLTKDGDLDGALADYSRAAARAPKEGTIYLERGIFFYLKLDDGERALADLERASLLLPKDPAPYKWMGMVMNSLQNRDGAIRAFGRALKRAPRRADLYYERGRLWWAKGAMDEAIADLSRSLELDPKQPSAFQLRSFCHERCGEPALAIADLSRAIDLKPSEAAFFTGRGELHLKLEAYEAAVADFKSALELRDWKDAKVMYQLGAAYLGLGDEESAAEEYRAAFEYDRRLLRDLRRSARVNRKLGRLRELRADLNILILADPRDYARLLDRARLSAEEGDFDAALADLGRALEILPRWDEAHFQRARIHAQMGRFDLAVEDMSKAIELAPHLPLHLTWRAIYRAHMNGDTPEARADLQRAVEIAHYDTDVRACRVTYFEMVGKPGDAIDDYDILILLDPKEPRHYKGRGTARMQAFGDDVESLNLAIADLQRAMDLYDPSRAKGDPEDADLASDPPEDEGDAYEKHAYEEYGDEDYEDD